MRGTSCRAWIETVPESNWWNQLDKPTTLTPDWGTTKTSLAPDWGTPRTSLAIPFQRSRKKFVNLNFILWKWIEKKSEVTQGREESISFPFHFIRANDVCDVPQSGANVVLRVRQSGANDALYVPQSGANDVVGLPQSGAIWWAMWS